MEKQVFLRLKEIVKLLYLNFKDVKTMSSYDQYYVYRLDLKIMEVTGFKQHLPIAFYVIFN